MAVTEPSTQTDERDDGYVFLEGNFAPVRDEVTVTDLEVEGAIPPSLTGRYLRTGPNPIDPDPATYHWFMGHGMVHGVDLRDGGATWYRNRFVRTPDYCAATGEPDVPRDEGGWYSGQGNTNVVHHAGSIWAITEGSLPYELTPELDTVRASNFGGPLPGGWNAHPKFDPVTNDLHVMSYGFEAPFARYHVISADGRVTKTVELEMGGPVMVHDMGFTATRVVVFDLPVVFSWDLAMTGSSIPFRWDPDYRARVGVLPRDGSADDTMWIDVEPCYVYHPLNAYDDGDRVVIDLVVHPRAFDDEKRGDPSQGVPTLQRWILDTTTRSVSCSVIHARGQEFPRADERLAGLPHRYGYSLGNQSFESLGGLGDDPRTALLKHDLVEGTTTAYEFGPGNAGSEFVFVPDAPDAGEDEGWLIGYAYDGARDKSDLMIFDAHDFGGDPVARVKLPVRVPQGFHGNWVPDVSLSKQSFESAR